MSSETEGAKGGREGMEGKKKRKESENTTKEHDSIDSDSPVIQTFLSFRTEMDSHHDKYERLVKISRDITIASKRIIFNLHRAVGVFVSPYSYSYGTICSRKEDAKYSIRNNSLFK